MERWHKVLSYSLLTTVLVVGFAACATLISVRWVHEIDINTGRLRHRVLIGPCEVSLRYEETACSRVMASIPSSGTESLWRPYMVERPWYRGLSNFAICGAISDLKGYFMVLDDMRVPHDEQKEAAEKLLHMVREKNYQGVSNAFNELGKVYAEWSNQQRTSSTE